MTEINAGSVVLTAILDTQKLEQELAKIKNQSQGLNTLIFPQVNLSQLHELNSLLDVKRKHLDSTNKYFSKHPIRPKIDASGLGEQVGKELARIPKEIIIKTRIRSVNENKKQLERTYENLPNKTGLGDRDLTKLESLLKANNAIFSRHADFYAGQSSRQIDLLSGLIEQSSATNSLLSQMSQSLVSEGQATRGIISQQTSLLTGRSEALQSSVNKNNVINQQIKSNTSKNLWRSVTTGASEQLGSKYANTVFGDAIANLSSISKKVVDETTRTGIEMSRSVGRGIGKTVGGAKVDFKADNVPEQLAVVLRDLIKNISNQVASDLTGVDINLGASFKGIVEQMKSFADDVESVASSLGTETLMEFAESLKQVQGSVEATVNGFKDLDPDRWEKVLSTLTLAVNNISTIAKEFPNAVQARKSLKAFTDGLDLAQKQAGKFSHDVSGASQAILVSGGFAGQDGQSGKAIASELQAMMPSAAVFGVENKTTDVQTPSDKNMRQWGLQALGKVIDIQVLKGMNPDAVDMAAQAMSIRQQNPELPIQLLGHSAGGMVVEEALSILKAAGVAGVRATSLGSPALAPTEATQNILKLEQSADQMSVLNKALFRLLPTLTNKDKLRTVQSQEGVKGIDAHKASAYLNNPEVQEYLNLQGLPELATEGLTGIIDQIALELAPLTQLDFGNIDNQVDLLQEFVAELVSVQQDLQKYQKIGGGEQVDVSMGFLEEFKSQAETSLGQLTTFSVIDNEIDKVNESLKSWYQTLKQATLSGDTKEIEETATLFYSAIGEAIAKISQLKSILGTTELPTDAKQQLGGKLNAVKASLSNKAKNQSRNLLIKAGVSPDLADSYQQNYLQSLQSQPNLDDLLPRKQSAPVATPQATAPRSNPEIVSVDSLEDFALQAAIHFAEGLAEGFDSVNLDEIAGNITEGLAQGIEQQSAQVEEAFRNLADSGVDAFKSANQIQSPSRVFAQLGKYIVFGLSTGITKTQGVADTAIKGLLKVTPATEKMVDQTFAQINKKIKANISAIKNSSNVSNKYKEKPSNTSGRKASVSGENVEEFEAIRTQIAQTEKEITKLQGFTKKREEIADKLNKASQAGNQALQAKYSRWLTLIDNQSKKIKEKQKEIAVLAQNENYGKVLKAKTLNFEDFVGIKSFVNSANKLDGLPEQLVQDFLEQFGDAWENMTLDEYAEKIQGEFTDFWLKSAKTIENVPQEEIERAFKQASDLINESAYIAMESNTVNDLFDVYEQLEQEPDVSGTIKAFDHVKQGLRDIAGLFVHLQILGGLFKSLQNLASISFPLAQKLESVSLQYNAIFGNSKGATELARITESANSFGLAIEQARDGYAQLSASLQSSEIAEETFDMFSGFQKYMSVMGLAAEAQGRALLAISQIAAKGRVSMEEISGQLSEAMPGSLQMGAQAMGMDVPQFIQKVSSGGVSAEELLPKLSAVVSKKADAYIASSMDTVTAQINILNNQLLLFKEGIGSLFLRLATIGLKVVNPVLEGISKNASLLATVFGSLTASIALISLSRLVKAALSIKSIVTQIPILGAVLQNAIQAISYNGLSFVLKQMGMWLGYTAGITAALTLILGVTQAVVSMNADIRKMLKEQEVSLNRIAKASLPQVEGQKLDEEMLAQSSHWFGQATDFFIVGIQKMFGRTNAEINQLASAGMWNGVSTWGAAENRQAVDLVSQLASSTDQVLAKLSGNVFNPQELEEFASRYKEIESEISNRAFVIEGLKLKPTSKENAEQIAELIKLNKESANELVELETSFVLGGKQELEDFLETLKSMEETIKQREAQGFTGFDSVKTFIEQQKKVAELAIDTLDNALEQTIVNIKRELDYIAGYIQELNDDISIRAAVSRAGITDQETQRNIGSAQSQAMQGVINAQEAQANYNNTLQKTLMLQESLANVPEATALAIQEATNQQGVALENIPLGEIEVLLQSPNLQDAPEQVQQTLELIKQVRQANVELAQSQEQASSSALQAVTSREALIDSLLGFRRQLEDVQLDVKDYQLNLDRQVEDMRRQVEDAVISLNRQLRDYVEKIQDFERDLARQLNEAGKELDSKARELARLRTSNDLRNSLGMGEGNPFAEVFKLFDQATQRQDELALSQYDIASSRLDTEKAILDLTRQIRAMEEEAFDIERQRQQQLLELARAQKDFVNQQYRSWLQISRQVEDMRREAQRMGFNFELTGNSIQAIATSMAEAAKKFQSFVDSISMTIQQVEMANTANNIANGGSNTVDSATGKILATPGANGIVLPVAGMNVKSQWQWGGRRVNPDGSPRTHYKVDYFPNDGVKQDDPIRAMIDGIIEVGGSERGEYMLYLTSLDKKIRITMGHVKNLQVKTGQQVQAGQHLANVGGEKGSWRSTGAHLDFGIRMGGKDIKPWEFLANPGKFIDVNKYVSKPAVQQNRQPVEQKWGHFKFPEVPKSELANVNQSIAGRQVQLQKEAAESWNRLSQAAKTAGINLEAISGFRSVEEQGRLWNAQVKKRGSEKEAARYSAPPGYSEHQTGYAIDIGDVDRANTRLNEAFAQTQAYRWLTQNASKFGFEQSFGQGNSQGVAFEPWHWRYTGDARAKSVFDTAMGRGGQTQTAVSQSSQVGVQNTSTTPSVKSKGKLTFDDGPNPATTPAVLEALKNSGQKATFYVVGAMAAQNPQLLQKAHKEGHTLGVHSYTHRDLTTLTESEIAKELRLTRDVINSTIREIDPGYKGVSLFRAPYGATNDKVNRAAESVGLTRSQGWDIDTQDWKKGTSSSAIRGQLQRARSNQTVLMHDAPDATWQIRNNSALLNQIRRHFPAYSPPSVHPDVNPNRGALISALTQNTQTVTQNTQATRSNTGNLGKYANITSANEDKAVEALRSTNAYNQANSETRVMAEVVARAEAFRKNFYSDSGGTYAGFGTKFFQNRYNAYGPGKIEQLPLETASQQLIQYDIPRFTKDVISTIGQQSWDKLGDGAKAGVLSVFYQYGAGKVPPVMMQAAKAGDSQAVANALDNLAKNTIYKNRRSYEARVARGEIKIDPGFVGGAIAQGISQATSNVSLPALQVGNPDLGLRSPAEIEKSLNLKTTADYGKTFGLNPSGSVASLTGIDFSSYIEMSKQVSSLRQQSMELDPQILKEKQEQAVKDTLEEINRLLITQQKTRISIGEEIRDLESKERNMLILGGKILTVEQELLKVRADVENNYKSELAALATQKIELESMVSSNQDYITKQREAIANSELDARLKEGLTKSLNNAVELQELYKQKLGATNDLAHKLQENMGKAVQEAVNFERINLTRPIADFLSSFNTDYLDLVGQGFERSIGGAIDAGAFNLRAQQMRLQRELENALFDIEVKRQKGEFAYQFDETGSVVTQDGKPVLRGQSEQDEIANSMKNMAVETALLKQNALLMSEVDLVQQLFEADMKALELQKAITQGKYEELNLEQAITAQRLEREFDTRDLELAKEYNKALMTGNMQLAERIQALRNANKANLESEQNNLRNEKALKKLEKASKDFITIDWSEIKDQKDISEWIESEKNAIGELFAQGQIGLEEWNELVGEFEGNLRKALKPMNQVLATMQEIAESEGTNFFKGMIEGMAKGLVQGDFWGVIGDQLLNTLGSLADKFTQTASEMIMKWIKGEPVFVQPPQEQLSPQDSLNVTVSTTEQALYRFMDAVALVTERLRTVGFDNTVTPSIFDPSMAGDAVRPRQYTFSQDSLPFSYNEPTDLIPFKQKTTRQQITIKQESLPIPEMGITPITPTFVPDNFWNKGEGFKQTDQAIGQLGQATADGAGAIAQATASGFNLLLGAMSGGASWLDIATGIFNAGVGIYGGIQSVRNGRNGLTVENYRDGGGVFALGQSVAEAMKREGAGAVPIVASIGEEVLSYQNGDAQHYRYLKNTGEWDNLKTMKNTPKVNNYRGGGSVGAIASNLSNRTINNNKSQSNTTINAPIIVSTPDANSFRKSQKQIERERKIRMERL